MKKVTKLIEIIFLAFGCNLLAGNSFWSENILPYVFLILCAQIVCSAEIKELTQELWKAKFFYFIICLAIFCLDFLTWMDGLSAGMILFIKDAIKAGMAALTSVIIVADFRMHIRNLRWKRNTLIGNIVMLLIGLIYFYVYQCKESTVLFPIMIYVLAGCIKCRKSYITKRDEKIILCGTAILLAIFQSMGFAAGEYWAYSSRKGEWAVMLILGVVTWSAMFEIVLEALFMLLSREFRSTFTESRNSVYLGIFVLTLAVKGLFLLNWYPGIIYKDTYIQIEQALGLEKYSNHHPWLYTMFLKCLMQFGELFGLSNQTKMAFITVISVVINSLLVVFILRYFGNKAVPKPVYFLIAFLYIVEPIHCIYAVSILKDSAFAYALLLYSFYLILMENWTREESQIRILKWTVYIILSCLVCFLKSNGLYAWIFTCPFLLFHFRKRIRPWVITTGIIVICILGYKGILLPGCHVEEPDMVESLSVPLQQIAFTVQDKGDFSEKDLEMLAHIGEVEQLGEVYSNHISDPVKNYIREQGDQDWIKENKGSFIKTYISIGLKNPIPYLVAFFNQSKGFWYQKMSNYIYLEEGVHRFAAEIGVQRDSVFPDRISELMDKVMQKYTDIWHRFWSLALTTYVMIFCITYCLIRKRTCFYFAPQVGVLLTLMIATPVNDEFRYVYGIYLAVPLMMLICAEQTKREKRTTE